MKLAAGGLQGELLICVVLGLLSLLCIFETSWNTACKMHYHLKATPELY